VKQDRIGELLALVEEAAVEARMWAHRLEEAVERNRAAACQAEELAKGGATDAGTDAGADDD
jgi:hypothetical protein